MNRVSTGPLNIYILVVIALINAGIFSPQIAAQGEAETPDPVAAFNLAQDLHEKGDFVGAIKQYELALKIEPSFPEAEYQCAVAHLALGRVANAETAIRRALELRPQWTLALSSLGSLLVQKGNFSEAEGILTKAMSLEPQNSSALVAMVDLRLKTHASVAQLNELLAKATTFTSKANPTASVWTARSSLEDALGRRDQARSSIAKALDIDPRNRNAVFQMAQMAIEDGDLVRAKEATKTLRSLSADPGLLKILDTNILLAEGNSDESGKAALEKQLEADTKNPILLARLCSSYRTSDPLKALGFCRRAADAEPTNINHAIGFGAALVQAKQFEAAAIVLRKIIEVAPDNSTAHANLATALFELKRFAEAKAQFIWLIEKQPKLAAGYLFLAVTHDRLGETVEAVANYQEFLRIADPVMNKLEIEKVDLRLPVLQKKMTRK